MFEKGHVFVYGASGVCRVEDICVRDYGAGKKEYYILQPVFDLRSSLSIPVDSPVFENHARELLQKEEVLEIIDSFPNTEAEWIRDDKERIETFRSLLEGGVRKDIATLIRSLYLHKKELAERAGLSLATITKMGKEGTVVTTDVLVKICVALNCEIGDIVEIVPDENA